MKNRMEITLDALMLASLSEGKTQKGLTLLAIGNTICGIIEDLYFDYINPDDIEDKSDEILDSMMVKLSGISTELVEFHRICLPDEVAKAVKKDCQTIKK